MFPRALVSCLVGVFKKHSDLQAFGVFRKVSGEEHTILYDRKQDLANLLSKALSRPTMPQLMVDTHRRTRTHTHKLVHRTRHTHTKCNPPRV
jgi:hypothetical protein